jgi:hypothetical protein
MKKTALQEMINIVQMDMNNGVEISMSVFMNMLKKAKDIEEQHNIDTSNVNRVEVIQYINGRVYVNNNAKNVEIQFQDDNKTLKIFLK